MSEEIKMEVTIKSNFTPVDELDHMVFTTSACRSILKVQPENVQLSVLAVLIEEVCTANGLDLMETYDLLKETSKFVNDVWPASVYSSLQKDSEN